MAGLTISRKIGQAVIIESPGFALVVNVEQTSRGKVTLNFRGPRDMQIFRGELFGNRKGDINRKD